ncbi:MAG: hypothetical protein ABSF84_03650 [Acidimicrobiales bacterium]
MSDSGNTDDGDGTPDGEPRDGGRPGPGRSGTTWDVRQHAEPAARDDGHGPGRRSEAPSESALTDSDLRTSLTICELIVAQVLRRENLGREASNALEHVVEELHATVRALTIRDR